MSEVYIPVPFLVAPDKCRMIRLATTEREICIKYHRVIVPAIKSLIYLTRIQMKYITIRTKFHVYLHHSIAHFV